MAMHKPKKQRRFQDGGDVEEDRMKQRGLDISNRAREEGTEKTSFFQRLREGNIDDPNSAAYKKYGAGRARLDDQIEAGKSKLAEEVREVVKAKTPAAAVQSSKATDGDVSAYDLRTETAANAPSRMPTSTSQSSSGRKPSAAKASKPVVAKTPEKDKPAAAPISRARATPVGSSPKQTMGGTYSNEGRGRPAPAAPEKRPGTALPINPSTLRQREEAEKKRDAARAAKRKAEEDEKKARPAKEAAERKALSEQPGAVAYRYKKEQEDKMSPGQRSAARGKAIKDFFGLKKGGSVSSASKRADGIAQRGKTRGRVY